LIDAQRQSKSTLRKIACEPNDSSRSSLRYRPPLSNSDCRRPFSSRLSRDTDAPRRADGTLVERLSDTLFARDACGPQLGNDRSYFGGYSISARYPSFPAGSLSPWCETIWHNSPRLTALNSIRPRPAPPTRRGGTWEAHWRRRWRRGCKWTAGRPGSRTGGSARRQRGWRRGIAAANREAQDTRRPRKRWRVQCVCLWRLLSWLLR
jgi:hypothetical protein